MTEEVIDPCIECGHSTAFGSGRFVNRVPGDTEEGYGGVYRTGFICAACLSEQCEVCGEWDHEPHMNIETGGYFCSECVPNIKEYQ